MLDGTMQIESVLGDGACFTVTIPESDSKTNDFSPDANETFFESDEETF